MKIAFFQPYIANWRSEFLARYISESKNQVLVFDGGFSPKKDLKSVSGVRHSFPVIRLKSWSPVFKYKGQAYPLYFSPGLFFALVRQRPDCIISEGEINFINNISVATYCFLFRKRYVWWSLGKVRTRKENILNRIFNPVVNALLRNADCVMARNTYAKTYYVSYKGISESKVIVAPNSMDEDRALSEVRCDDARLAEERAGKRVLLYVGAMTAEKRPEDLLRALQILHAQGRTDVVAWFVGDGPERERLQNLARHMGLGASCKFWGKIFSGVGGYFLNSDVVVVPGLGGLVINHAMIFSKPVISRIADGTELDLIHEGKNGFVLKDYDNAELAAAIIRVIDSTSLSEMGDYSRSIVDQSWNMKLMIDRVDACVELATS